ncbi:helicase 2 [Peridroma alphabaculovirus]|uniref:Helicase 2 n=1 Tax=Peridroma alphabaculovirus TaxID=1346829 RepID=A0A068LKQ6_9ABAC|nr:helicase 2 [Peridroma alphabaculovirus]AIE47773.1 helicase 2 [Peridroma alphabaculovirus]
MSALNDDQSAFMRICDATLDQRQQLIAFVTGNAGTGKTFLLKHLNTHLADRNLLVERIAFSALAAQNINGKTMHKLFKFNLRGHYKLTDFLIQDLMHIDVLIIDEVSMIHGSYLDKIDEILRVVMGRNVPFGGVHVIAFGDLYQLPPVVDREWVNPTASSEKCYSAAVWKEFRLYTLRQMMRQSEPDFIRALNQLRVGDEKGIQYFNELRDRQKAIDSMEATTLVSTVAAAHAINTKNNKTLLENADETHELVSTSKVMPAVDPDFLYPHKNMHQVVPDKLTLCVGSRIIVTVNCKDSECVNGDLGVVEKFGKRNGRVVCILFRNVHNVLKSVVSETINFRTENPTDYKRMVARTGFPINLAWAMTIHKMQGATIDRLRVPLCSMFAVGQLYVALSRVTRSDGLELLQSIKPSMLRTDTILRHVYSEMPELEMPPRVDALLDGLEVDDFEKE